MPTLCTVTDCKTFTGITTTAFDAFFALIVPMVDFLIKKEINRSIISQTANIVEFINGNNTETILLSHTPVQSVQEVRIDDLGYGGSNPTGFDNTTILVAGTDYYLETGRGILDETGTLQRWTDVGKLKSINRLWDWRNVRIPGRLATGSDYGQGNIKVTYTAGFTSSPNTVPPDLNFAAILVCAQVKAARTMGVMPQAEGLSEYHYSISRLIYEYLQTGTVASVLAKYRRVLG